jgi:tetratricopeptide (TPR) repeat protein
MKISKILLLFSLFFTTIKVVAQMPVIKISKENSADLEKSVKLQKLNIDVQITGNIATTVMTMTFYNESSRILEGELTFPMPEGVTVSRYALDINGKMREAVPVEKAKATEVFENIERRNIDPGLIEKVEGNNFRTRIYPLPAKGTRTIIVGYEQELIMLGGNKLKYNLPLTSNYALESFKLKTTIFDSITKPEMTERPDGSFELQGSGNTYIGTINKSNYKLNKGLSIALPKRAEVPEILMQKASSGYYFLVNVFPKTAVKSKIWANTIGLIWDVSLSGLQRNKAKELELLDLLIKQKQNLTINLGLLNNNFVKDGSYKIINGNWDILRKKLENSVYDGGTNYSLINNKSFLADEYLMFSDGLSTFGKSSVALNKPVYTINSSLKADYSTLKYISLKSGGDFVNLNSNTPQQAFDALNQVNLKYLGIKNGSSIRQTYPSLQENVNGHFSLAGILNGINTDFILQFGYGDKVTTEVPIRLNGTEHALSTIDVSRVWAQKKIAEMDIQYEDNKEDISTLSKQFGIVTRNTSLIVLETVQDYIRYQIAPPAELRAAYDAIAKTNRQQLLEQRQDLLKSAERMTAELKTWWNTDFNNIKTKNNDYPIPVADSGQVLNETVVFSAPVTAAAQEQRRVAMARSERAMVAEGVAGNAAFKRVSINASGKVSGLGVDKNQPKIIAYEFKSDKDYMKNLVGSTDSAYAAYLKMRADYISTPMYYFDVANWFYQQKDKNRALTILSSIADLDLENADLFKTMAYKLKQEGETENVIFIAEKVLKWRPMDAQSYRDYALALQDMGKYQQALDYLYKVLTNTYSDQTINRDRGIEEIIITEINNIILKHGKSLDLSKIDKKLIAAIPVDVRVVINWNKNDTDIDLWVTDPNGEKCFYSHKKTVIGGRISNDFTAGYGPEQFMLKKAIKGKYKIEVNYYGDRQISISGPTTVSAEIYTKYGNGQQVRKIIVRPLDKSNKEGNLVGEFEF